jgi:MFS family permease
LCHAQAIASFQILNILIDPIKRDLLVTDTQYSLLQGLAVAIFAALLGLPAARWADRRSRRNVVLLGSIGWSVATAAGSVVVNFEQLFVSRVLMGIGEVFLFPAAIALIADLVPRHKLSSAIAVFACGGPVGAAAALAGGGWMVTHQSTVTALIPALAGVAAWRSAFLICGASGFISVALVAMIRETRRPHVATTAAFSAVAYLTEHWRLYARVSGGMICLTICAFACSSWIPTVLSRTHALDPGLVGVLTGSASLIGGLGLVTLVGQLIDRLGTRGHTDGVLLASMVLAALVAGLTVLSAANIDPRISIAAWVSVYALLGIPTVLAGTALQVITPAPIRAQVLAIHLLLVNLIALSLGPTLVALITDSLFGDPGAVGRSLAIVSSLSAVAALSLFWTVRPRFAAKCDGLE